MAADLLQEAQETAERDARARLMYEADMRKEAKEAKNEREG